MHLKLYIDQIKNLTHYSFKVLSSDRERLFSPILFALTILVMFSFAFGNVEPQLTHKIFVAETFLTALFAVQICFARIFEPDQQDKAFLILKTYPIAPSAWFLSKFIVVFVFGLSIVIPTMMISALFLQIEFENIFNLSMLIIICLVIVGLAPLGILLSTMMIQTTSRQILYPLLYFPLTTPVLLAAVSSALAKLEEQANLWQQINSWLGLLMAFDIIYFTLGTLLFSELIHTD